MKSQGHEMGIATVHVDTRVHVFNNPSTVAQNQQLLCTNKVYIFSFIFNAILATITVSWILIRTGTRDATSFPESEGIAGTYPTLEEGSSLPHEPEEPSDGLPHQVALLLSDSEVAKFH